MTGEVEKELEAVTRKVRSISWGRIWVWVLSFVVLLGLGLGGMISYASSYETRVLPGVNVGSVSIGGMDREALTTFFREMNNKLVDAGIVLSFSDEDTTERVHIETSVVSEDAFFELIHMNVDQEVEHFLSYLLCLRACQSHTSSLRLSPSREIDSKKWLPNDWRHIPNRHRTQLLWSVASIHLCLPW